MKFVKCVAALHMDEVDAICENELYAEKQDKRCFLVKNGMQRKYPTLFPFGNNPEIMKKINDEANGPYKFLVIFYRD
jgi:hypothetical protein